MASFAFETAASLTSDLWPPSGSPQSGPSTAGSGLAWALPGPGTLGRQSGMFLVHVVDDPIKKLLDEVCTEDLDPSCGPSHEQSPEEGLVLDQGPPWVLRLSLCAGPVGGDLPLRAEAAPELRQRAAAAAGLHLGQDPRRRQRKWPETPKQEVSVPESSPQRRSQTCRSQLGNFQEGSSETPSPISTVEYS